MNEINIENLRLEEKIKNSVSSASNDVCDDQHSIVRDDNEEFDGNHKQLIFKNLINILKKKSKN